MALNVDWLKKILSGVNVTRSCDIVVEIEFKNIILYISY